MAEEVKFTQEDYLKSIVRIFAQETNNVIGTGFLISPGYVLTCAHVVLQAIGIDKKEFASYETMPPEEIKIDFPQLDIGNKINTKVVAWLPYNISQGDVAGLKLLQAEPSEAKPIPLIQVGWLDIKDDEHSVYGFGKENGEQSDAYKLKTVSAGGRFQFYKAGDPNDETIEGGFSGAPVWNKKLNRVIGMMATARITKIEQKNKAYAIPKKELDRVLKQLSAYSLWDLIENNLQQLFSDQKQKLSSAISAVFNLCGSGLVWREKETLQSRLLALSQLGEGDWNGVERLTQFAVFLATMDAVPGPMYQQIESWVKYRGFKFEHLLNCATLEKRERNISSAYASEHLVVEVRPDEQEEEGVCISIWTIGDRQTYDPEEPYPPLLQGKTLTLSELPDFIETWLEDESTLKEPMVHFFVPRAWLACNFDSCRTESELTLGSQYKLVMRTDLNQSPTGKQYYKRWQDKWQLLEAKALHIAQTTFVRADATKKAQLFTKLKSAEMAILENLTEAQVKDVFTFISKKTALPVVLWVRRSELNNVVNCVLDRTVAELPERILQERCDALDDENNNNGLGYHLSLVWEDPKIVPPTMNLPFDQENY